jgi:chromosome segregation ATPase
LVLARISGPSLPTICVDPRRVFTRRLLTNLLNTTMTKPSNNIMPGGKTDEETDEEPEDDVSADRSEANEEEIVRLKQQLTDQQNQRARFERQVKRLETKLETSEETCEDLKRKHEKCEATRVAEGKKLKADLKVLKLKETSALNVASTSSKVLDDVSKEVIRNKSVCIRDLQKQIADQAKTINKGKDLQEKVDTLKAKVVDLTKAKTKWGNEKKKISKTNAILKKKVNAQVKAKYAHQEKMAQLALEAKQVILDTSRQRQGMVTERNQAIQEGKRDLIELNFAMRDGAKVKDLERKEEAKAKKTKAHADRIQVVSSEMLRTNRINGGSFPNAGHSFQEVSAAERVQ